jgi:ring-1,2-phenylacetyl-CoA epoxidase subunit PaaE
MSDYHLLQIKTIHRETPDTVSVGFEIPENLQENYQFFAGQYVFINKEIDGEIYKRAYSITAKPLSKAIQITIKQTPKGEFSRYANTQLKVGDKLEVSFPKGNFILPTKQDNTKNYLGFATGSGIAPIYAMILAVLENEPNSKFGLFYGNPNPENTIFKSNLDLLLEKYPTRFFVQYVYSQDVQDGAITGRIGKLMVDFVIQQKFHGIKWEQFYICGQEEMKEQVSNTLLANGVAENAIYFELFSKPKKSVNVTMTIIIDGEKKEVVVPKTTLVMDAAIDADLDPPYSCQGGFCMSCVAKITEGQAVMEENKTLNDAELAEGKILTCVARATTDKLTVNFDI